MNLRPSGYEPDELPAAPSRDVAPGFPGGFKINPATTYSPRACAQVPSALEGLTSVFGMGTGVPPPVWPPENLCGFIRTFKTSQRILWKTIATEFKVKPSTY